MNKQLYKKLIKIAERETRSNDSAHDFRHSLRVLQNVEVIAKKEGGDLDVLVPAALFHDAVIYPKNHRKSSKAPLESSVLTRSILKKEKKFPQNKIDAVCLAIEECSFHKKSEPEDIEAKILRDADKLEATGIVAIMRTFSSTENMRISFYDLKDPFCERRKPDSQRFGLDLFYDRLFLVKDRMYTKTARKIAIERTKFLELFIKNTKIISCFHFYSTSIYQLIHF